MEKSKKMTYNQTVQLIDMIIANVDSDETFIGDFLRNSAQHTLIIYFDSGQKIEITTVVAILVRVIAGLYGEEHGKRGLAIYGSRGRSKPIAIEYQENGVYVGYNDGSLL